MQDLQDTETHLKVIGKGRGLRLVALVILQIHPLKGNILSSHQVFPVQHQFSRTRRTLYHILHTNSPPVGPTFIYFYPPPVSPPLIHDRGSHAGNRLALSTSRPSLPLPAACAPPPPCRRASSSGGASSTSPTPAELPPH
jgi:hypothetical protein